MDLKLINHTVLSTSTSYAEGISDNLSMIQAPSIWDVSDHGSDVVIAVLDTGVCRSHPDLKDNIIGGKNFTTDYNGDPNNYEDNHFHGSHVAGIIAALANGQGVIGVSPKAKLLIYKVLNGNGQGNYDWTIKAIREAINWRGVNSEKVSIINMSLGGPFPSDELHQAIKDAVAANIAVVCAAGNDGDGSADTDEISYPGYYEEVIEVGGIDSYANIARFSNSNNLIDCVAPSIAINSTYINDGYAKLSGTSMAAPHVSGALALIIRHFEHMYGRRPTEPELYVELMERTKPINKDVRMQGRGIPLLNTFTYNPENINLTDALNNMRDMGIIDTPEFWINLADKFKSDPEKYDDFRHVELLIKKFFAHLVK